MEEAETALSQCHSGLVLFVEVDAREPLFEVEAVKVVEGHKVAVAAEDEHSVLEEGDRLPVAGARFFANDETVRVVVEHFVARLAARDLLRADGLQRLQHRLSGGGKGARLPGRFLLAELPQQLLFLLKELFVFALNENLPHRVAALLGAFGRRHPLQRELAPRGALPPRLPQRGGAFEDAVSGGVDFAPRGRRYLKGVNVVLLLCDALNAAEQEQVLPEQHH